MKFQTDRAEIFVAPTADPFYLLRGLLAASDTGLLIADSDTLLAANTALARLLGFVAPTGTEISPSVRVTDVVIAATDREIWSQTSADDVRKHLADLKDRKVAFQLDIPTLTDKVHAVAGTPLSGSLYTLSVADVSEHRAQERELAAANASAEFAKAALQKLDNPISIKNDRQQYVFVNDAYCAAFQAGSDQFIGRTAAEVAQKPQTRMIADLDTQILESGTRREYLEVEDDDPLHPRFFHVRRSRIETRSGARLILCARNDITQLKRKESELSKALQKAELSEQVLEQLKTPVVVRDEDHRCIMVNQAYADYFALDRTDVLNRTTAELLPPDFAARMMIFDKSVFSSGEAREDENEHILENGAVVRTVTYKGIARVSGHKPFVVTTFSDITRYKRQEVLLKEALEKAQLAELVLDQLSIPLHVKDENLRYVMANKAYTEALGQPRDFLTGKTADEVFPADRAAETNHSERIVFNSGLAQEFEDRLLLHTGVTMPVIIRRGITRTDQSREYLVTAFNDITRLKDKERQLRDALKTAELSKQVLDCLGNPIVVKDANLRYVMVNSAFCSLFGHHSSAMVGLKPSEIVNEKEASQAESIGLAVIQDGQTRETESDLATASGQIIATQNRHSYLRTSDGDFVITILNDVSRLRHQERQLKAALEKAELSEAVLDQLTSPVVVKNESLTYVMANKSYCEIMQKARDEIIGKNATHLYAAHEAGYLRERDRHVLVTAKVEEMDESIPLPGNRSLASITRKSLARTKSGEAFVVTIINDVTKLKDREQALERALTADDLSGLVLDQVATPVTAKDAQMKYAIVNSAFSDLFGLSKEDMLGKTSFECLPEETALALEKLDRAVLQTGQPIRTEAKLLANQLGQERATITSKCLATTESGERYVVGVITDISDLKRRERELEDARRIAEERNQILLETKSQAEFDSLHDPLTGLPNRRFLDVRLQEWRSGTRQKELALLQIDLDRFKAINDTLGHAAGDFILQHVAAVLRENCAESDFIARIGGDEFVVLRESEVAREELEYLADQIITELNKPVPYENELCRFGASIGIDIGIASMGEDYSDHASDPSRLMMNADIALYRAKQQGRGRFTFFTREIQKEIERTKRISDDILDGLEKGEFFPVYQPQFDAKSLQLIGVEALARWHHPVLGVLAPPSFLDAAKQLGAADRIDHAILEAALVDMQEWDANNSPVNRVAVNVSAQRIANPFLINLLKKLQIPHGRLAFEVHESTMLDHTNLDLKERIKQIAELGIDIEIDNFGTGQSSFLGMWSASPKRVKIDRELVHPIVAHPEHRRLLQAVIDMGRSINLEVVSEGVETVQHIKILRDMGCDILQGYALAKPMTNGELVEFSHVNQQFALRG